MTNERIQNRVYTTDGKDAGTEEEIVKGGTNVGDQNGLDCVHDERLRRRIIFYGFEKKNRFFGQYIIVTLRKEADLTCFFFFENRQTLFSY